MGKPATVLAKVMIDTVHRLRAEAGGAFPAPRAVRDKVGGSQDRAEAAVLTVQIHSGMTPHLRSTLPADFEAELPPAADIPSLTAAATSNLPSAAQVAAEQFFAAMGAAHQTELAVLREKTAAATAEYIAQTTAMHKRLVASARQIDEQERLASESADRHAAERAELREQLAGVRSEVRAAEQALAFHTNAYDAAMVTARDAASTSAMKHQQDMDRLTSELSKERDTCREAEKAVSGLTATNAALCAENTRLVTELAAQTARTTPVAAPKRARGKAVAA